MHAIFNPTYLNVPFVFRHANQEGALITFMTEEAVSKLIGGIEKIPLILDLEVTYGTTVQVVHRVGRGEDKWRKVLIRKSGNYIDSIYACILSNSN